MRSFPRTAARQVQGHNSNADRRYSDISAPSPRMLEKRHSDYNLFRHGSMNKWTAEELQQHALNLQKQVTALAQQNLRIQEKQDTIDYITKNRRTPENNDIANLKHKS